MAKSRSYTLFCFLFNFLLLNSTHAQSVVKPNDAQKKVLDKAIPIIIKILDQFNSPDWELSSDFYSDPSVSINPSVPLDIDQNFEREYKIKNNSDRFNRLIKPINERINELMQQQPIPYDSVKALGEKQKSMSNVTVYVYINRKTLDITPDPKTDLKIPGVAIAQKAPGEYFKSNKGYSYWLCFGNWKTANFKFKHPNNTPYIENIVVIFFGAEDRVQELLQKIDWRILNDALTL
ncbi:MAG: hypothetical protein JST17_03445 [Bacteroidetes bacterium]|nr:hypothetical protein [Bacteroidota bacterium]MBS1929463.1 hypothetical protein [Bacteroidota bacterium]